MKNEQLNTKFAPAERASKEEIKRQVDIFKSNDVLDEFLGKIPAVFIVVNEYRQIVYMNRGALEFTGLDDLSLAVGKRPGEVIGCVHASEGEGGCGTYESCTYCGAVNAVLSSQKGKPTVEECRLILGPNEVAFDLRVWASPLVINGDQFSAVTIQDIRHEKRRAMIERIFFHDILNTANGLLNTLEFLQMHGNKIDQKEFLERMDYLTKKLIEEIRSQRTLNEAENNSLTINLSTFNTLDFLNELVDFYEKHDITLKKAIQIQTDVEAVEITSDRTLLWRIISNIIKNALEATPKGEKITLGCDVVDDEVQFWVHNSGFIPRDVQLQIFQRSFSTKGPNRGLGTYSMKILSSFLKGNISFTTSLEKGTTFKACYPLNSTS